MEQSGFQQTCERTWCQTKPDLVANHRPERSGLLGAPTSHSRLSLRKNSSFSNLLLWSGTTRGIFSLSLKSYFVWYETSNSNASLLPCAPRPSLTHFRVSPVWIKSFRRLRSGGLCPEKANGFRRGTRLDRSLALALSLSFALSLSLSPPSLSVPLSLSPPLSFSLPSVFLSLAPSLSLTPPVCLWVLRKQRPLVVPVNLWAGYAFWLYFFLLRVRVWSRVRVTVWSHFCDCDSESSRPNVNPSQYLNFKKWQYES